VAVVVERAELERALRRVGVIERERRIEAELGRIVVLGRDRDRRRRLGNAGAGSSILLRSGARCRVPRCGRARECVCDDSSKSRVPMAKAIVRQYSRSSKAGTSWMKMSSASKMPRIGNSRSWFGAK
jgi:hypothetical protein